MKLNKKILDIILKLPNDDEMLLLINLIGERSDRYLEAEDFINQIPKLPWYIRLFGLKKYVLEYNKNLLRKYDF